jgi:hypothetical protein
VDIPINPLTKLPLGHAGQAIAKASAVMAEKAKNDVYLPITRVAAPSDLQAALGATFERVQAWMLTMRILSNPLYFQAACAGCRGILESLMDLAALDKWPADVAKWKAYAEVNHFEHAEKFVKLAKANPGEAESAIADKNALAVVNDPLKRASVDALKATHWNGKTPGNHWRCRNSASLARELGPRFELRYASIYHISSLGVHAGPSNRLTESPDAVENALCLCHLRAQQFFDEAIQIVIPHFDELKSKPNLRNEILRARNMA